MTDSTTPPGSPRITAGWAARSYQPSGENALLSDTRTPGGLPLANPRPGAVRRRDPAPPSRASFAPRDVPLHPFSELSRAVREQSDTRARLAGRPPEIVHGPREVAQPALPQLPREEPSNRNISAPRAVPPTSDFRILTLDPSKWRVPSGPRVAPHSEYLQDSRAIRSFVDTPAPWATPPAGAIRGPRVPPLPTTSQLPAASLLERDTYIPEPGHHPALRRPEALCARGPFLGSSRRPDPGAYLLPSMDDRAPWAAPPAEPVRGPRVPPLPTASQLPGARLLGRDTYAPEPVHHPALRRPPAAHARGPVLRPPRIPDLQVHLRPPVINRTPLAPPPAEVVQGPRVAPLSRTSQPTGARSSSTDISTSEPGHFPAVRRPLALRARGPVFAALGPPDPPAYLLPSIDERAPGAAPSPATSNRLRIAYRSTREETARGYPPFQILSAPWAISPPGPPFESRSAQGSTPQGIPGINPISMTAQAPSLATAMRNRPSGITPSTPREVLRPAQPLQTRLTASPETLTQSLLYDPDATTRSVIARRGPSLQICTTSSATMLAPPRNGGLRSQNRTSSKQTHKPRGGIDLFWTPDGIDPSHAEWNFPARIMQAYYIAKDEKKKLRAAKIAKFSHLEEKLLDRAVYEFDILDDASCMEQLFGMTYREISEKGWKTKIFEGPITSFEARYTKIFNMDMNIARLQNRHLRIERHASRIRRGRVPQLPPPPKPCFPELPTRKMIAEKAAQEAAAKYEERCRLDNERRRRYEERRRLDREAVQQRPPGVSEEIAGEARLAWHWTEEDWAEYWEDERESRRRRGC